MGADWKPGTVAVVTLNGEEFRAMRTGTPSNMGWEVVRPSSRYWVGDESEFGQVTDVRPLVVLDLDESQGGSRLLPRWLRNNVSEVERASISPTPIGKDMRWLADQIEAQTKPPRIPEPGWSGRVLAHTLDDPTPREYVRFTASRNQFSTKQWYGRGGSQAQRWDDLIDPVLIREGVE